MYRMAATVTPYSHPNSFEESHAPVMHVLRARENHPGRTAGQLIPRWGVNPTILDSAHAAGVQPPGHLEPDRPLAQALYP
jgi:hypothetical protein